MLRRHGATAESAALLPDEGWSMAAELAGVKPPSDATKAVVAALLAPVPDDPFEGLVGPCPSR